MANAKLAATPATAVVALVGMDRHRMLSKTHIDLIVVVTKSLPQLYD